METILKIRSEVHKTLKKNPIQILRTNNLLLGGEKYGEKIDYINILPNKESLLFFVPNDPKIKTSVVYESSIKFEGLSLQTRNDRDIAKIYNSLISFTDNILLELESSDNYNKWCEDFNLEPGKHLNLDLETSKPNPLKEEECVNPEKFMYAKNRYYFSFMIFEDSFSTKGLALTNEIFPSTFKLGYYIESKFPARLRTLSIFPGYKIYKKPLDNVVRKELT